MALYTPSISSHLSTLLDEKFCISLIDVNGHLTYVNQNFCELTGYSEDELIGRTWKKLNKNLSVEEMLYTLTKHFLHATVYQESIQIYSKSGTVHWLDINIVPIYDSAKNLTGYLSLDIDVTRSKLVSNEYDKTRTDLQNFKYALDESAVVVITNPQGVITYVNNRFCILSEYSRKELIGKTHRVVNSGTHPKSFFVNMWETIQSGQVWRGVIRNKSKSGNFYWVHTTIVPFIGQDGKPFQYISIRQDVTSQMEAEKSLELALKNDFTMTVKNLQNAIFKYSFDENNQINITLLEGKVAEQLGITANTLNQLTTNKAFMSSTFKRQLLGALLGRVGQFEIDYHSRTFLVYLSPIFEGENVVEVVGTASDITDRKEVERLVEHMAFHDHLTGLPNRRLLKQTVEDLIETRLNNQQPFALLYMDLDRFKNINDSMGHFVGDQLLKAVGARLQTLVRQNDLVGRLSGDEFLILCSSTTKQGAQMVAQRIVNEISKSFLIDYLEVFIAPSIGISMFPDDGAQYDTLIRNADSAMYLAKQSGKSTYQFFTEELYKDLMERTLIEMELRQVLQKKELSLHYQPQYEFNTGNMIGIEALVRWQHPSRGVIPPGQFIPIAEETGMILAIGLWVLETACRQAKEWQDLGYTSLLMSVNVSLRQFKSSSFVADVKNTLHKTGLQPQYLNIEITESMTSDVDYCQSILQELRDIGIKISIDDFGTGYSSLSYLTKFPLTHLKIDQSFVRELHSNSVIVKAIIDLAKNLHLRVIAEGVETYEQAEFLKKLECDEAQGFLYSRPVPPNELLQLLNNIKS
ncbi:bifunctional diguanylate cyclase/phosphodiesterase [Sporosarcina sp. P1]|uniref:bifunctional diguanylate cyclase/phosphodiesterase n=1 Tax=Sporosarcina sp. P1 TaxID=2048257 RepID=UPI000C168514|nr:bifunctional diguanylate cyclase/phosphodiesterase [Sporosarcina sp. P1]PIC84121.1 PAS domain S-box protein [Sporosarcina sp. P1]